MIEQPWVKKYKPKISEFIFQNDHHRNIIETILENKELKTHLLFAGSPGTGKTTLAHILRDELGVDKSDFMMVDASDETSVETVRGTIKSFCKVSPNGDFKLILLDEADYLSKNAQASLRGIMEKYMSSVKFILTCNYPNKIIPALKTSRCPQIDFKELPKDKILKFMAKVLLNEKIKITSKDILQEYIDMYYPDMRAILNNMSINVVKGELQPPVSESNNVVENMVDVVSLLEEDKWLEAIDAVVENIGDGEWEDAYQFLYDYLEDIGKFKEDSNKWKRGIVIIADHLYRHSFFANPEINFSSCLIRLSDV